MPTRVLHMTRAERLPSIVAEGLLPDNAVAGSELGGVDIGYRHIKDRRARRQVPCGARGSLGDYVPFYFAPRSPMLYAITRGQLGAEAAKTERIVYLQTSTQALISAGVTVVYSSHNAVLKYGEFTDSDRDLDGDDFIDWPLMTDRYWVNTDDDPDRKERRQAECLAHSAVAWDVMDSVITKTQDAAEVVREVLRASGTSTPVDVRPEWYF